MKAAKKSKSDLAFVYRHFMLNGTDIPDSYCGHGAAKNAYVVARKTGKLPFWCVPGSMAYWAAKAGINHHKKTKA